MKLQIILIIILLNGVLALIPSNLYSQNKDQVKSRNLWKINETTYLFKEDSINELWQIDKSLDIWKLNDFIEILTFNNNKLRLWKQSGDASLWFYDKLIKDWKLNNSIVLEKHSINDSIQYSIINDTTKLIFYNHKQLVCNTLKNIFTWNKNTSSNKKIINDSVNFYKIHDTLSLWIHNDSSALWAINSKAKIWKISQSTIVWTLNPYTEFWKAGTNYNIWNRKTLKDQWQVNTKIIPKQLDSIYQQWIPNDTVMIWSAKDSVKIWRPAKSKKIWSVNDSLKIWLVPIPKKVIIKTDSVIVPPREVKKAELLDIDESIKLWTINDSTRLFYINHKPELWKKNSSAKLWKISDSTQIWNINQKTKLTYINDSLTIWLKNDTSYEWKVDGIRKAKRINDNLLFLNINDSIRFTNQKDSLQIWNSSSAARIATKRNINDFLILNDTIEFWQPNDSTKLWINKYAENGQIWEKNKQVNILNINDSTKIWQINENVRLTIINNQLKIWRQGIDDPYLSWKESKEFKNEKIQDSIKIWHINSNTIIWETKQKIEVWNLNKKLELLRLNDTSLIWTYSATLVPPKLPKPKFWIMVGTGKLDMAQVWVDKWASGGQSSISTLFIINFQANYNKKKVKWTNDFEYRYGFIKPDKEVIRKNEDKIKINSIINYYAFKKWYYGLTAEAQTQFFKGYQYVNDTTKKVVSDIVSPFYSNIGLGLNYFPIKQLSVFFSPITNKMVFVSDTTLVKQTSFGVEQGKRIKNEPGAFIKSNLNWNITKNINLVNKFDLFLRYYDIQKYNVDWELIMTFKFNNLINATLNTHLVYDPNILTKKPDGTSKSQVQFKEVLSIGLFYKI